MMTQDELTRYISDGVTRAKQGAAAEVLHQIIPYQDSNAIPHTSHYAYGWILYYALHQCADHDILSRKILLGRYLRLQVPRPHKLHSMILDEANRLYKNAKDSAYGKRREDVVHFSIISFAELWNLSNLRPGDWRRHTLGDKTLSSTVEKFITCYVDELEEDLATPNITKSANSTGSADQRKTPSPAFKAVMHRALTEYADNPMLFAQMATLSLLADDRKNAIEHLRHALLMAPGKFFLWSRLASLIDVTENRHLHIALLYKALRAPGPEQMKGRVHLSMAQAWTRIGMHSQALYELNEIERIYSNGEWHLPKLHASLSAEIPADTEPVNPSQLYRKIETHAEHYLYDSLPTLRVAKTYHKASTEATRYGRAQTSWRVTDIDGNHYWLQPTRHRLNTDLPLGIQLDIRLFNGKVVDAQIADK